MGNLQPGDVPFVQNSSQWQGTDFSFNENTTITPPGQQYQIVTTLPTPVASLEGSLFYILGTGGVPGALYVLRKNAAGVLVYTKFGGRAVRLWMSSADFTPFGTGYDSVVKVVPYDPSEMPTLVSITWTVVDIFLRVETPAVSGTTSMQVARSTGTGVFSNVGFLNTSPVSITSGLYEPTVRPAVISQTTVNSGDKLKLYYPQLGANAAGFSAYVDLRETN